ncbi:flagellar hook protein [Methylobacterium currus]|uniref:flagellin N-terminal helical domain-containing protein n=1 Tax=Methylobacterium currus TaxID=2051553 RepID=UPI001E5E262C|nr:flagellin [Methylobacterium currus]UHC18672.1 flagellar hook protein [Methylobacterium currus]
MSSGITLSAATRQNLLSLQGTADLLSTTQSRLSTGKKINTALDSPSNYFTAQGLTSRSSALSGLLDGVSNSIQTIQAANTGITKLQGLADQLKSVAQQALSASNAFTAKAGVSSTALTGATANNLLSVGATTAVGEGAVGVGTAVQQKAVSADVTDAAAIKTALFASSSTTTISIDGVNVTLNETIDGQNQTDLLKAINNQLKAAGSAVTATLATNKITLNGTADGGKFDLGTDTATTGLFATGTDRTAGAFKPTATSLATGLGFVAGDTFTVNGQAVTVGRTDTMSSLAQKVSTATNGTVSATYDATNMKFSFTAADSATAIVLGDGSTTTAKVSKLGFSNITNYGAGQGSTVADTTTTPPSQKFTKSKLDGQTITVKVGDGNAVSLTFGSAAGQVSTLNQLNAALAPGNAMASIDSTTGAIKITTTNEAGGDNLTLSASGNGTGLPFSSATSTAIIGGDGANTRNGLVNTYNGLLNQIDQMAADSGFNGTNLLAGDTINVSFNEKGTSSLKITGSPVTAALLGMNAIGQVDFQDSNSINAVIKNINSASSQLKSQASSLGANLAVVQNRQDFTKQMINVLDTGAANLTNADLNEEAANSQALSTRNSLGISALSLANQAQQGILQLLR